MFSPPQSTGRGVEIEDEMGHLEMASRFNSSMDGQMQAGPPNYWESGWLGGIQFSVAFRLGVPAIAVCASLDTPLTRMTIHLTKWSEAARS